MKQEGAGRLLDAVGDIDDDLIEETVRFRQRSPRKCGKTENRRRLMTMMVTLSAAALIALTIFRFTGGFSRPVEVSKGTAPAAAEKAPAFYAAAEEDDAAMKKSADNAQESAAASTGAPESAAAVQQYEIRSADPRNRESQSYLVASSFEGTVSSEKNDAAQDNALAGAAAAPNTVTFHVGGLLLPNGHIVSYKVRVTAGVEEIKQTAEQKTKTYDFSAAGRRYKVRIAASSLSGKAENFTVKADDGALKDIVIYVQDISENDENGKKQDSSVTYQDILSDSDFWDSLSITKTE